MREIIGDKLYIGQGSTTPPADLPKVTEGTLTLKIRKGRIIYIRIFWKKAHQDVKIDISDILPDQRGTKTQTSYIETDYQGGSLIIKGYNADPSTYHEIPIEVLLEY